MTPPDQTNPENPENNNSSNQERAAGAHRSHSAGAHRADKSSGSTPPNGSDSGNQWRELTDRISEKVSPVLTSAQDWTREVITPGSRSTSDLAAGRATPRTRAKQGGVAVAALGVLGIVVGSMSGGSQPSVDEAAQTGAIQAGAPGSPQAGSAVEAAPAPAPASAPAVPAVGIDVSNHNGAIDWKKVAEGGQHFAFILSSDGEKFTSKTYDQQHKGAKDAGLYTGAYHFGRPSGSATGQADKMLQTIHFDKNDKKALPPVLDLEPDPDSGGCYGKSPDEMVKWTKDFLGKIKEGTGKDGIIYASPSFWNKCTANSQEFKDNPLWLASYGVDKPTVPAGFKDYAFWQHSDSGKVPGVEGEVDVNKFNGTTADLKQLAQK